MEPKNRTTLFCKALPQLLFLALFVVALGIGGPAVAHAQAAGPETAAPEQPAHYIVFDKHVDGTIVPVYYRLVGLAKPLQSITEERMAAALVAPSRDVDEIAVSLQDGAGQVVYQNVVQITPWLRGEFSGKNPGDPIDGHLLPRKTTAFVVRVPQIPGTTLVLQNQGRQTLARFGMEQLASQTPAIQFAPSLRVASASPTTGPASNREDLLVMGDGYTAAQQAQFGSDATAVVTDFFSIAPYSVYENYYNIHTLFTTSNESGADHPPYSATCGAGDLSCCTDIEMQSDPLQGMMVDTAFDSHFCTAGIHRLLMADDEKVYAAAAVEPDWDSILLLVNDTTYGGSGGGIATISMNSAAPMIAQHEYGHSFVHLADEYDSPYPGYPRCSDISSAYTPCESNVTDQTVRAKIKWAPWIKSTTPIPTPDDYHYDGLVGLIQGARYRPTGMYRPSTYCIMGYLGAPYCQIPSQSYVLSLYHDINLIEPGGVSPAGKTLHLARPASQTFNVSVLSPVGGPAVQITWLKNGVVVPGAHSATYKFTTSASTPPLTHLTVRVKDVTTLVNASMAGSALQNEFTWNVYADVKTLTYKSVGLKDGWVLEAGANTGLGGIANNAAAVIRVGDDEANQQYRGILSFDTSSLPDTAVIANATLKLMNQGNVGSDPFSLLGTLQADIRKPYFGAGLGLAADDFQAAANLPAAAVFGASPVGGWYSAVVSSAGRAFVNRRGTTQFRLLFSLPNNADALADYASFFSGNAAPANRPQLVIQYYVP